MKTVLKIRHIFQLLVLISVLGIIGTIGAWETGSIHFAQFLLQLLLFSGSAWFSSNLSHRRFFIRVRRTRTRPAYARHPAVARPSYAATRL